MLRRSQQDDHIDLALDQLRDHAVIVRIEQGLAILDPNVLS